MGLFNWLLGGLKDFIVGFVKEIFNWLVEVVVEIADKIGQIIDAILSLFGFVPLTGKMFDRFARAVLWFVPDVGFRIFYIGLAVIGIVLIVKIVFKLFGK